MPVYRFTALSHRGRKIRGEQEARDEIALSRQLNKIGLQLLHARLKKNRREWSIFTPFQWILEGLENLVKWVAGPPTRSAYDPDTFARGKKSRKDIRIRIPKTSDAQLVTFDFCAKTSLGRRLYGEMEAANENDLANRLLLIELTLIRAKLVEPTKLKNVSLLPVRLPMREEILLSKQLAMYSDLDLLMTSILNEMRIGADSRQSRALIIGIRNRVVNGDNLAAAIGHYKHFFSRFFLAAIDVANETGHYSGVMDYANRHLTWLYGLLASVRRDLRGPFITLTIVTALLPLIVLLLYRVSRQLLFIVVPQTGQLARILGRFTYELPLLGKLSMDYDTLNFTYFFVMMWEAGVEVVPALNKSKAVIHNAALRHEVSRIEEAVTTGSTLTDAFMRANYFPVSLVAAIRSAEMTGNFSTVIDSYYFFATRRFEDAVFELTWKARLLLLIVSAVSIMSLVRFTYPGL
jgi:type II secretory pathway component PulF